MGKIQVSRGIGIIVLLLIISFLGQPSMGAGARTALAENLPASGQNLKGTTAGITAAGVTATYRVKPGDSLWQIARRYNLEVQTLAALNGMSPDAILPVGRVLKLADTTDRVHRVLAGQTLWRIAQTYKVTVAEIMRLNQIKDPRQLQVGQVLLLPPAKEAAPASVAGTPVSGTLSSRAGGLFSWPLVGTLTSLYGKRKGETHHGIDIAAETGTPIKAARSGKVVYAGWLEVYGRTVIIDHGDGTRTLYGHASKLQVKKGEQVKTGQVIARVGSSGRATGPHLHFEIYQETKTVNPLTYLKR